LAVEATKCAFSIRNAVVSDPARMKEDPQSLLHPRNLDTLAARINRSEARPWRSTDGAGDTVWLGVIDASGCAVSFIQSIYHEFGSGVVSESTGICWQNRGCSFSLDPGHINAL